MEPLKYSDDVIEGITRLYSDQPIMVHMVNIGNPHLLQYIDGSYSNSIPFDKYLSAVTPEDHAKLREFIAVNREKSALHDKIYQAVTAYRQAAYEEETRK